MLDLYNGSLGKRFFRKANILYNEIIHELFYAETQSIFCSIWGNYAFLDTYGDDDDDVDLDDLIEEFDTGMEPTIPQTNAKE